MLRNRFAFIISSLIFVLILCGCSGKSGDKEKTNGGKKAARNSDYFFFVGKIGKNPGLFKYVFDKKEPVKFWSNEKEKVIELSYSPDRKYAFFLTAEGIGKLGIFSYINNVKLYLLNAGAGEISFIKTIGSGLQVFTSWESKSTFKIILNYPDKSVVAYVNQKTEYYNIFGKELESETKAYDITKEGYPKPAESVEKEFNYDNKLKIYYSDSAKTIALKEISSDKDLFSISSNQSLKNAVWTKDGAFIVFSTLDISQGNSTLNSSSAETSRIFIYSVRNNKIVKEWTGSGIKNFFIINNYLIFDDGFQKKSTVNIVNMKSLKEFDTIKIKGGCGLRSIPQLPDYSRQ